MTRKTGKPDLVEHITMTITQTNLKSIKVAEKLSGVVRVGNEQIEMETKKVIFRHEKSGVNIPRVDP